MWRKEIGDVFFRNIQRIKRFLTSKDLFIFLFFLLISTGLWGLHAMRKTYETVIQIPVTYENFPLGYVQVGKLPEKLRVTVSDRGNVLLNYRAAKRFTPVPLTLEEPLSDRMAFNTKELESAIQKQLNATTQIVRISPGILQLEFVKLKNKNLPVKLNQRIELAQQYTWSDTITIKPYQIEVYAPENILDTMQFAYTEQLVLADLKDTVKKTVKMQELQDVAYSSPSVDVTLKTELYTEKTVQVPIDVTNVPAHYILRTFPSVATISFQLGVSLYDKVDDSSFILTVDYNELLKNSQSKQLPVEIEKQPDKIFNVRINPRQVEFLVEE